MYGYFLLLYHFMFNLFDDVQNNVDLMSLLLFCNLNKLKLSLIMIINSNKSTQNNSILSLNILLKNKAQEIRDKNFKISSYLSQSIPSSPNKTTQEPQSFMHMFRKLRHKIKSQIKQIKQKNIVKILANSSSFVCQAINSPQSENKNYNYNNKYDNNLNSKQKVKTTESQAYIQFSHIKLQNFINNKRKRKMSNTYSYQKVCKGSTLSRPKTNYYHKTSSLKIKTQNFIIDKGMQQNFVPLGQIHGNKGTPRYQITKKQSNSNDNNNNKQQQQPPLRQIYDKPTIKFSQLQHDNNNKKIYRNMRKLYSSYKLQYAQKPTHLSKKISVNKPIPESMRQTNYQNNQRQNSNTLQITPWFQQKF